MSFTFSSADFGSEDFGNGVVLSASTTCLSNVGHPNSEYATKWTLKATVSIYHFNTCIACDSFTKEMTSNPTDEEKKTFIMNAAETFRDINADTIERLKNTFSPDAVKVLQNMLEEIQGLRDTVDTLEERISYLDADC